MANIINYTTTNTIISNALNAYINSLDFSTSDLLRSALTNLSSFNSYFAAEYQTGRYTSGMANDGGFIVSTANYAVEGWGSISVSGSNISHVAILNKTNGARLDAYGSFIYAGNPIVSNQTAGFIQSVLETYQSSSNPSITIQDQFTGNLVYSVGGTYSGNLTDILEVGFNSTTNLGAGIEIAGTMPVSTNIFNPNLTSVGAGSISSLKQAVFNFNLSPSTNYISDYQTVSGINNWPLSTKINALQLNTGSDIYTLSGSQSIVAMGGSGNDEFILLGSPNSSVNGMSGIDKVTYSGQVSKYIISIGSQASAVKDSNGIRNGTDTLTNIERLQFTDTNIALDIGSTQTAGSAYLLYQAAFNRHPDTPGVGYWIAQLDKGANLVTDVAQAFINSPEFISLYGANPSVSNYVNLLYQNVLHRAGEAGGVNYWNGQLNNNIFTRAQVLEYFAASPENVAAVAPDIAHGIQYQQWVG